MNRNGSYSGPYEIGQYRQTTQAGTTIYGRRLGPYRSIRSAASELRSWAKTGIECTVLDRNDNDVTVQALEQIRSWRERHASALIVAGMLLLGAALHGQSAKGAATTATTKPQAARAGAACVVNVNTASPEQIAYLYRTGEVLAGRIIEARQAAPAHRLDAKALDAVKGIGAQWLASNGPHVRFGSEATTCVAKVAGPTKATTTKGGAK